MTNASAYEGLLEEQKRLEEESAGLTLRRAHKAQRRAQEREQEAHTGAGSVMVNRVLLPVARRLQADQERLREGRPGRRAAALLALKGLDAVLISEVAVRAALGRMSKSTSLTAIVLRIADAVEDEHLWHRWEQLDPAQAKAVKNIVLRSRSDHQRHASLRGFARRWNADVLGKKWSKHLKAQIGGLFVDYLEGCHVLQRCKLPSKQYRDKHALQLSQEAESWVGEMQEWLVSHRPVYQPMVVPPKPWTAPEGGGFLFQEYIDHPGIPLGLRPLPLVRRSSRDRKVALSQADLEGVYAGLNVAQATPWRINPRTFEVLDQLYRQGKASPGLPDFNPEARPPSPGPSASPAEVRDYKRARRQLEERNAKSISKRKAAHATYSAARKFSRYEAIYFAHNLDFRGRVYPCSDALSFQGNDLQRGLLEFAHGDPLTNDGVRWLKIHLANTWGEDKVSFGDRERWADLREEMILEVARHPLDCIEWWKAECPWQFLAACFAWADYRQHGLGVVCRVPVMLDGSCSGIQHWAALLRDERTGAAVNLVPGDTPGDLYEDVARRVRETLQSDRPGEIPLDMARAWVSWGIDRRIVKNSVMNRPYGLQYESHLRNIRKAVLKKGSPPFDTDSLKEAVVHLAKVVWDAMGDVMAVPLAGMDYVRRIVRECQQAAPSSKFMWTAPSGLPVLLDYRVTPRQHAKLMIGGDAVSIAYQRDADDDARRINWKKAKDSAPPNFIHSLDATHLLRSLKRAGDLGITQIAVVHDAFGTTPSRIEEFRNVLREEFAALYAEDNLEALRKAAQERGAKLPKPPEMGTLRVEEIARSEYLFG